MSVRLSSRPLKLKRIFQRKLDQPWIHAGAGDDSKGRRGGERGSRIVELRVIEGIEEFRPKLHLLAFCDLRSLHEGDVPIELTRAKKHTDAAIAVIESIADGGR